MLKVCVIGGGPSGLMAAYTASLKGHQVELFEKNKQLVDIGVPVNPT